jgi:hypothetical protein
MKEKEIIALNKTTELWCALIDLDVLHPDDINEARRDIHNIQNRILARKATRGVFNKSIEDAKM